MSLGVVVGKWTSSQASEIEKWIIVDIHSYGNVRTGASSKGRCFCTQRCEFLLWMNRQSSDGLRV